LTKSLRKRFIAMYTLHMRVSKREINRKVINRASRQDLPSGKVQECAEREAMTSICVLLR
jgi:hypothetical protein